MSADVQHQAKLRWQCRRGMLELDLLLTAFLEKVFPTLAPSDQQMFTELLTCTDQDLYDWLVKHQHVHDAKLVNLVERVRNCA